MINLLTHYHINKLKKIVVVIPLELRLAIFVELLLPLREELCQKYADRIPHKLMSNLVDRFCITSTNHKVKAYMHVCFEAKLTYNTAYSYFSSMNDFTLVIEIDGDEFFTKAKQVAIANATTVYVECYGDVEDNIIHGQLTNCKHKVTKWYGTLDNVNCALEYPNIKYAELEPENTRCNLCDIVKEWKLLEKLCNIELAYIDKPTLSLTEKLKKVKPSKMTLHPKVELYWRANNPQYNPEVVDFLNISYQFYSPNYDLTGMVNLETLEILLDCEELQVENVTARILEPIRSMKYLKCFVFEVYGISHHWHICDYLPPSLKYLQYGDYRKNPPIEKLKVHPNLNCVVLVAGKIKADVTMSRASILHMAKGSIKNVNRRKTTFKIKF
ncbi:hypothetical protein DAMA08_013190 [Martiniozyma asiatica (nom. inval.)]|nr:hypothetical protein DAMA08_013190 [Martiniozyma asiatica]